MLRPSPPPSPPAAAPPVASAQATHDARAPSSTSPRRDAALARSATARTTRIRELIVTLELAPGRVVSERDLMERLGLGRTPVREALRDLAREKLVEVYPRRGIFVSPVDVGDIAGLSEVRITLEPAAARLAAQRSTEADRAETRGAPRRARGDRAQRADERALIELDQRIHRHVYRCAHNPFVEATLNEYYVLTLRIWFLALDRVTERLDDAVTSTASCSRRSATATPSAPSGRCARTSSLRRGDPGRALSASIRRGEELTASDRGISLRRELIYQTRRPIP